ncbi:maleylpyruvate isomerase N-terminal domain-containing protein [Amycolatopsis alkalitolerans]|uniref:maleylpyruvate isomerase N-terminal domain-containing protein n=1 Tax=Amycolatopsis alkalitolerans TaxID=2547244 RepID=UPI0013579B88|nr:maleylpyruvate isomerase N-terminal domain-containing protein [Amycolatopsis alkalitolerans]
MDIALLHEVTEDFAAYLSEVTDGDLAAATPCALWTVEDLYHHMVDLNLRFARAVGHPPPPPRECLPRETIYRDSARHAAHALARANGSAPRDAFESHLTNTVVHTWDLAQAIRIDFDPPWPDVLDIALNCVRRTQPRADGEGWAFLPCGSAMEEILVRSGRAWI